MELRYFTDMLYWLELNFCEFNVDDEAILLLNNSSVIMWTSGKASSVKSNLYFIYMTKTILCICLHRQSN